MFKFICKPKEQPKVYKNDKQLIKWLIKDLKEQRKNIAKKQRKKNAVKDEELILNIGYAEYIIKDGHLVSNKEDSTKGKTKVEINFDFNFGNIISEVLDIKIDENKKYTCPYNVNCSNVTFKSGKDSKKGADFKRIVFKEKPYFTYTVFEGEADFKWAEFKKTDYGDDSCTFNNTCLYDRSAFWGISIDGTLTFENIKLTDKSNIYFGGIKNKETTIEIKNTVVSGRIDFNDLEIKEIDFEKSIVVGNGVVTRIRFGTKCSNFQTARLLKHEAYKISNVIEGLKYKAIEKDLYEKELMDKDKSMQVLSEILSIKLSKLSNNHGQNWLKAVAFTIISGFMFLTFSIKPLFFIQSLYILLPISLIAFMCKDIYKYLLNTVLIYIILFWFTPFLYEIVCSNKGLYIDNFFPYLMPTSFKPISSFEITTNNERLISYTTYFMGKIAIGYGMVEIVQAFRKLNSK